MQRSFGPVLGAPTWVDFEAQILLAGVQLVKVLTRRPGEATEDLLAGVQASQEER